MSARKDRMDMSVRNAMNVRKERMPPEHLRRIMRISRSTHPSFMGAMKYMPYALHNLLRAIPMPWESIRYVDVVYHVSGLITFVTDRRRVDEKEYKERWSGVSRRFSHEVKRRGIIRTLKYPVFDDDDEVVDYGDIIGLPSPRAIACDGEMNVFEDVNEKYLFNWRSFSVSRSVGVQLENGPYVVERSSRKVVVMEREVGYERIAYPYLYNNDVDVSVLEKQNIDVRSDVRNVRVDVKRRHPVDIPLLKGLYLQERVNGPRPRILLKNYVRNMEKVRRRRSPTGILKELKNTRYFQRTEIDWVEAGLQLIYQGHRMLSEVLRRKKLSYLILDWNFNLKAARPLTTKERKKSRVGTSFHLTREMLKLIKHVVDVHVLFRQGSIDSYELMNNVDHVFNNVGILTGMYRYKYRLMRQIKQCKALKRLSEYEGVCGWMEQWRTWCFMLRGHISLLGGYISGLVMRMAEGRKYNAKPLSKQRNESGYDIALKRRIIGEISSIVRPSQIKRILQHFGEAWRCWKANLPYHLVYEQIKGIEDKRIEKNEIEENNLNGPVMTRMMIGTVCISSSQGLMRFSDGFIDELSDRARMIGIPHHDELFELQRIIEKYIQLKCEWYIESATNDKDKSKKMEKKRLGKITRLYMKEEMSRQMEYLRGPFLKPTEAVAIYKLTSLYLKEKGTGKIPFPEKNEERFLKIAIDRLKVSGTVEECEFFDKTLENGPETIFKIKRALLSQRSFKDVGMSLKRYDDGAIECYDVSYMERLVDAFVCAYLFYECDRLDVFPSFIKPGDELEMRSVMNFCEEISMIDTEDGKYVLYEGRYEGLMKMIDNNLLCKLLKLILDPILVDYIVSRNNCQVLYKDMTYTNHIGFIRGFEFSSFIYKFYSFVIDLCVLGGDIFMKGRIRYYRRYMDDMYVLFRFDDEEIKSMEVEGVIGCSEGVIDDITNEMRKNYFVNELASDEDRMIGGYAHIEMATRLLPGLGRIKARGYCILPCIRFSMCGVDVMISSDRIHERSSWRLKSGRYANLAVSNERIELMKSDVSHIVSSSGSATFLKIANRWNRLVLSFVACYRESIYDTPGLIDELKRAEHQIQNAVKKGMNSKMPIRFPPVLFYSPREMGGLGMLSMARINIPQDDLRDVDEERSIPMVIEYVERWDVEFDESDRVWKEYGRSGKIEMDKGIPRMSTLVHRDESLFYDRGFRMINIFRRYSCMKPDWFWFTSVRHDGRLWSTDGYTIEVLKRLGGVNGICDHTLFNATYFRSFSKVFWEESVMMKYKRLTNAQRTGLNQIPNRRFMLWWSPTINRGNVYVGYQIQLELSGIVMHGKLPTLKISFVQIFRNHLWKKIHESVVDDLCGVLKRYCDVKKMEIDSKKSYRLSSSSADIVLSGDFSVSSPMSIEETGEYVIECSDVWIDVQLRWGDYDKRDCHKYSKIRFIESRNDPLSKYPVKNGLVIVIDLCYNTWSAYGNINDGLRSVLKSSMEMIISENVMLHILRERLRKALQLYTSEVEEIKNGNELFNSGLLVDTRMLLKKQRLLFIFDPMNGNVYYRSYVGENKKIRHLRLLAAQDVFSLGESLNKKNVSVGPDLMDSMENFIIDHPNVSLRLCNSIPSFSNIMRIGDIRTGDMCGESLRSVDLYRGWDKTTRFSNFCRLLLIIQGLEVDETRVRELGIDVIWPDCDDGEWIRKEIELKDIVVGDYCRINGMSSDGLSQDEVRDIVFGFKVSVEMRETVEDRRDNKKGGVLVSFGDNNSWRTRYMTLDERRSEIPIRCSDGSDDGLRIPLNLIEEFILVMDPQSLMFGLIISGDINGGVISFGLVPQFSSGSEIHSSSFVPDVVDIIGIVINSDRMDVVDVLVKRYKICRSYVILIHDEVRVMRWNDEWKEVPLVLDDSVGIFYVPEMWNYNFARSYYDDGLEYTLIIGTPSRFYDGFSRVGHFSKFWSARNDE